MLSDNDGVTFQIKPDESAHPSYPPPSSRHVPTHTQTNAHAGKHLHTGVSDDPLSEKSSLGGLLHMHTNRSGCLGVRYGITGPWELGIWVGDLSGDTEVTGVSRTTQSIYTW